jgi:hypothetical protein
MRTGIDRLNRVLRAVGVFLIFAVGSVARADDMPRHAPALPESGMPGEVHGREHAPGDPDGHDAPHEDFSTENEFDFNISLDRRTPAAVCPFISSRSRAFMSGSIRSRSARAAVVDDPLGRHATFTIPPVDDGSWASLVEPGDERGVHRLSLLAVFEDTAGDRSRLLRQEYELTLPEMYLARTGTSELLPPQPVPEAPAPAPEADNQSKISIPLTILAWVLFNFRGGGGGGFDVVPRRMLPSRKQPGTEDPAGAADPSFEGRRQKCSSMPG